MQYLTRFFYLINDKENTEKWKKEIAKPNLNDKLGEVEMDLEEEKHIFFDNKKNFKLRYNDIGSFGISNDFTMDEECLVCGLTYEAERKFEILQIVLFPGKDTNGKKTTKHKHLAD
jgi:hypothetical protein